MLFEKVGRVGLITLNRPDVLNAWSAEMAAGVAEAVNDCNANSAIGAMVITGAGPGFCAGADLRRRGPDAGAPPDPKQAAELYPGHEIPQLFAQSKPIIAAINGAAVGVGFTLTLCCDIRVASTLARVSARFVRIGLTPELASTFYLPQIVGLGNAAEMILTGRICDAAEAQRLGVVNKVVRPERLIEEALALGEEIAFNPHDQVRLAKQLLYKNATNSDTAGVQRAESAVLERVMQSEAFREAARAFIEKREPSFHQDEN